MAVMLSMLSIYLLPCEGMSKVFGNSEVPVHWIKNSLLVTLSIVTRSMALANCSPLGLAC